MAWAMDKLLPEPARVAVGAVCRVADGAERYGLPVDLVERCTAAVESAAVSLRDAPPALLAALVVEMERPEPSAAELAGAAVQLATAAAAVGLVAAVDHFAGDRASRVLGRFLLDVVGAIPAESAANVAALVGAK